MPKAPKSKATVEAKVCDHTDPLTPALAKELLGWREAKKKEEVLLKDRENTPIVCDRNVKNRPLYSGIWGSLRQEILFKRWQLNGEPIIIGNKKSVLNGQHTLIALVLAGQEYAAAPHECPCWTEEPWIEKLVVYGIKETDAIVNTMDTCKARSLADVVFRASFWRKEKKLVRRAVSRATDHAIRMLWRRTGEGARAFAPRRTHAESIDFLENHIKLLECVRHCYEEDNGSERRITKYISLGYASAVMYLMASCMSDGSKYYTETRSEKELDFKLWDKACDFWTSLAAGADSMRDLVKAFAEMLSTRPGTLDERCALLTKAWLQVLDGKPIKAKDLKLDYQVNEEGFSTLVESPVLGGIDMLDEEEIKETVPRKEVIAERAVRERKQTEGVRKGKRAKKGEWHAGDRAWVCEPGEEPYFGNLKGEPYDTDGGLRVMVDGDGGEWEAKTEWLSIKKKAALGITT